MPKSQTRSGIPEGQCYCRECNVELVPYENWPLSYMTYRRYFCRACYKQKHNGTQMYVDGKYIPKSHPYHRPGKYKNFQEAAFGLLEEEGSGSPEGYVYIITNRAWPEWVKIGMAIDAEDRLKGYQTSSPMRDFVLEYSVYTNNRRLSEEEAHKEATKVCLDSNNEWFKMTVGSAKHILDNLNEQHNGLPEETSEDKKEDKLQKRSQQEDLWSYAENKEAERAA